MPCLSPSDHNGRGVALAIVGGGGEWWDGQGGYRRGPSWIRARQDTSPSNSPYYQPSWKNAAHHRHRHHHCQYHALVYPDCHMGANQDPWETTKTHGSQSMPLGSYQPRLLGANQPRPLRANQDPWETIKTHGSQSRTLGANQPILLGNNQLCWTKTHGSQPRSLRANQHPWEPIKFDWWSQRKGLAWLRKWHDKKVSEIIVM